MRVLAAIGQPLVKRLHSPARRPCQAETAAGSISPADTTAATIRTAMAASGSAAITGTPIPSMTRSTAALAATGTVDTGTAAATTAVLNTAALRRVKKDRCG